MNTGLQPYPAMKPSGVDWLGDVPEHWEVRRLRDATNVRVSNVDKHVKPKETPVRLCNYVDVYKNDHINGRINFMLATATFEEIERFRLEAGDVLITKDSETWDDIGVPALVTEPAPDLISGYHLAILRPRTGEVIGGFLLRALQSKGLAYQFHVAARGVTRYGLAHAGIKSARLPVPPLGEQAAIVRYLDHVDRRISRYIRAKQRLIELLEEEKQAIVHRAVTRGLDPDVPLKPSGVEWLGDVPEHWEVRKLGVLFKRHGSGTTPSGDEHYGGGIPWVMTGDLTDGNVDTTKRTVTSAAVESVSALRMYPPRSLVVAMYGATIGRTGILSMDACTNQACCVLADPADGIDVYFLQAVVNLARPHLIEQSYGGGQPNINSEIVKILRVPVPPPREQKTISAHVARTVENQVIGRARRAIELLGEYRVGLIADVVTGKLDVREAAADLPEADDADLEDIIEIDDVAADELAPELEEVAT